MNLNVTGLLNKFNNSNKNKRKHFTTADMNSEYNQMPLDKQSRRLTQFVIGNHRYGFNGLFYGISIGPAAFSAFMGKFLGPIILKKKTITYLDDFFFMQSQTKDEMFIVLEQYHQILKKENMKAAHKSQFFLRRVNFLGHAFE